MCGCIIMCVWTDECAKMLTLGFCWSFLPHALMDFSGLKYPWVVWYMWCQHEVIYLGVIYGHFTNMLKMLHSLQKLKHFDGTCMELASGNADLYRIWGQKSFRVKWGQCWLRAANINIWSYVLMDFNWTWTQEHLGHLHYNTIISIINLLTILLVFYYVTFWGHAVLLPLHGKTQ